MIVWSFDWMETLSGIDRLPKLKKIELGGDNDNCHIYPVRKAIEEHPNHPDLKYNGQHLR
jgi:hypothetical protein